MEGKWSKLTMAQVDALCDVLEVTSADLFELDG